MAKTLEELASQLDSDQEFHGLPQSEQDAVFAELAKGIEQPGQAQAQPVEQAPTHKTFSDLNPLQKAFYPSAFIREGVGNQVGQNLQTIKSLIDATGMGQLARATTPTPLRMIGDIAPRQIGQIAGQAASLPIDPSTYAFGGIGAIPSRLARVALGATAGGLSAAGQPDPNLGGVALGTLAGGVGSGLTKVTRKGIEANLPRMTKQPRTLTDIRTLPEKQLAKLSSTDRQAYMASRNLEDQQIIAVERQNIAKKYQDVITKVRQDQKTLGQAAPAVAHERLKGLAEPFNKLRTAQNTAYRNGINEALAAAPEGDIFFTKDQINEAIANKYLQPQFPGQPPILQEDPTEYRQLINLLDQHPIVNKNEMSTRDILNMADSEYSMSPAAKSGLKSPTPSQTQAAHLRDILLDLLESRGMPVRAVKTDWKEWVPVRNLGFKLQSPSGPSQVIRIVKGLDPVRAEHLDQLEALIGQPLRSEVKGIFNQLDSLEQQKVIEGTKRLEAQRLLQEKIGFMKGSRIEQKLRLDQMARHSEKVNELIFDVAKGAAAAVGLGAVGGAAYAIKKFFD